MSEFYESVEAKRVVITGGPSSVKTSLIEALSKRGYPILPERSRLYIQEAQRTNSDVTPWQNLYAFSDIVLEARVQDFHKAQLGEWNFYDRGLPDTLAYMHKDSMKIPDDWIAKTVAFRYEKRVFIAPAWEDIFQTDGERKEAWTDCLEIDKYLRSTYESFGYDLIEIPKVSVEERLYFIFKSLL